MFTTKNYTREISSDNTKNQNKLEKSEKFLIGCHAISGKPVAAIAEEIGASRQYVYNQKAKVIEYVRELDEDQVKAPVIELSKRNINRIILSLSFDCGATNDGVVRFFEEAIREKTVSPGYISGLLAEAKDRAEIFDRNIDLSGIHQGANDEIFQCGIPILTGVDPETTFAYLLEEAKDRSADTWKTYLEDRKEQGLNLETTINDGGSGLLAGIPQAFPNIEIQADTFHAVYELGKEMSKLERKTNKLINNEYAIKDNLAGKRPKIENKEVLKEIQPKVREAINIFDNLSILYIWVKELLCFSGYSLNETTNLMLWILNEMEKLSIEIPSLQKEIEKIRKIIPNLLSFIRRLEHGMDTVARETGIPIEGLRLMYQQLTFRPGTQENNDIQYAQVLALGERYDEARSYFDKLIKKTKKASSLVENLNGRIRGYIEIKRIIPTDFFVLLKVYFNTRRFKRSRCKERIGKSPLELLTGKPQPSFLEALGY